MAALPYMPLYVADYLADAAHLTTVQHGAYLLLIMNYWQRGEPLPNDDVRLARIARVGQREWAKMRDTLSEFFEVGCSTWSHNRIDGELARVAAKSLKSKKAAQASVKRRFGGRSADVEPTDTDTEEGSVDKSTGGKPPDPVKDLFDVGVSILTSAGQTEKQARSLIGKWRKAKKSDGEVLTGLLDCRARAISNPVEWLEKRFTVARYVSKGGYEYRGDPETVLREAQRRNDMDTYWRVKGDMKREAA
jgi:uncharacterized protein YdaU (DUF1376 family)